MLAQKIRSIIAASSENLVEWFDFYIYAFAATYFAHTFSTSDNPVIQQQCLLGGQLLAVASTSIMFLFFSIDDMKN